MEENRTLDISWGTIIKIAVSFLGFYILYLIRDILVWIAFALVISVLFEPAINFLQKRWVPRFLAVTLVYVIVFGIWGLIIYATIPLFVVETQSFFEDFSMNFEKISSSLRSIGLTELQSFEDFVGIVQNWLMKVSSNIFSAISVVFGGIFSAVTIFSIAMFISMEERGIERGLAIFVPKKYETFALSLWEHSRDKVSAWFGSRILACFFVGILTFLSCKILDIELAVSFGLLSAVLNIIPIIGPVLTGAVIFMFVVASDWFKTILILAIFFLIQQIEGNIITPFLTKKFIGLPPALVIVALIIGGKLWGLLGAVLAIPLGGIIFEFSRDFMKKSKEEKPEAVVEIPKV